MSTEMTDFSELHSARFARSFWAEKIGTKIYMYAWEYNAIYIYDEVAKKSYIRKGNPDYDGCIHCLYESSVVYKDCIYFIPGTSNSSDILKYNFKSQKIEYLKINTRQTSYSAVIIREMLYLLPIYYGERIIRINLECDEISYMKNDYGRFDKRSKLEGTPLFYGVVKKDCTIWRACLFAPFIQKFYYEEQRIDYIKVNGIDEGFVSLAYDGQYFWLLLLKGKRLIKWDAEENRIIQRFNFEKAETDEYVYTHLFYHKGHIWIIPRKGCVLETIDTASGERESINCEVVKEFRTDSAEAQSFAEGYLICDDYIYFIPFQSNGIVKIHAESRKLFFISTQIDQKELVDMIVAHNSYNESMCSVGNFIEFSCSGNKKQTVLNEKHGHTIWNHIIDEV